MKKILVEAANVGTATARALTFRYPDKIQRYYPNSAWGTAFIGGSHEFLDGGARLLNGRTFMLFYATGITPRDGQEDASGRGFTIRGRLC